MNRTKTNQKTKPAPYNQKRWSKNDDDLLTKMTERKSANSHIARTLGRSIQAVAFRKHVLGLRNGLVLSEKSDPVAPKIRVKRKETAKNVLDQEKVKRGRKVSAQQKSIEFDFKNETEMVKMKNEIRESQKRVIQFEEIREIAKSLGAKITITFE